MLSICMPERRFEAWARVRFVTPGATAQIAHIWAICAVASVKFWPYARARRVGCFVRLLHQLQGYPTGHKKSVYTAAPPPDPDFS